MFILEESCDVDQMVMYKNIVLIVIRWELFSFFSTILFIYLLSFIYISSKKNPLSRDENEDSKGGYRKKEGE